MESIGTNVLFSLYPPVRYDMPADAEDISLEVHHWNAKFDARIPRLAYVVYSQPYQWTERDLEQAPLNLSKLTHFMRTYFIQVPENIRLDGNLPELAITIVTQANIKNPYQAVKAIQQWLETNCKYTRLPGVLKKKPTDDPVLSFLFETRKGHCEYFATAQALLTRALGIPARVVNGFRGGEWNELGQFYLIRQRDAHSWVEVYLDNVGWFPVDPSPKEEERRFAFQSHLFSKYYNYFQSLWDRSVISYSPNRIGFSYNPIKSLYFNFQAIAARSAHGLNLEGSESIKTIIGKLAVGFLFLFGLCVMIVLVFKGWRIFWTVIRPGKSSNSGKSSIRFYDEMLRLLDRRGFYRAENRTPAEFAQELISIKGSTYAPIEKITHFYYKSRYAEKRLTESETQEVRSLLKELIQRLKHER